MRKPTLITSRTNERVKALREGFRGKASQPGELVSVEGGILLEEAARAGLKVESVFVREGLEAPVAEAVEGKLFVLSESVFASAVDTRAPQGVAALVRVPEARTLRVGDVRGVGLLLESVQDPGNLGTLIRSAEAFGAEAVFLTGECANPWSPKVLRASAGSVFRIPLARVNSFAEDVADPGIARYAAVAERVFASNVLETKLRFPCVFMVGNEGAGLSSAAMEAATDRVWIPCATESLNAAVAGSLLLYEAMRQRTAVALP